MLSQGMYGNPLVPVYLVPDVLQERISVNPDYNYKNHFEVYDPKLGANAQYWPLGNMGMAKSLLDNQPESVQSEKETFTRWDRSKI